MTRRWVSKNAHTIVPGHETTRMCTSPAQCLRRATACAWDTSVRGYWFTAKIKSPHLEGRKHSNEMMAAICKKFLDF